MVPCCFLNGFSVFISYFVGSVPTGPWVARWRGVHNLHELGSGNSGATNVGRVLGPAYFFLVFSLDVVKAWGYLALINELGVDQSSQFLAAAFLMLGNGYSIFLHGRGGKGVATGIGLIAYYSPGLLLWLLPIWLLVLLATRQVGIASVAAACALAVFGTKIIAEQPELGLLMVGSAIFIVVRHRSNIENFIRGWWHGV